MHRNKSIKYNSLPEALSETCLDAPRMAMRPFLALAEFKYAVLAV